MVGAVWIQLYNTKIRFCNGHTKGNTSILSIVELVLQFDVGPNDRLVDLRD